MAYDWNWFFGPNSIIGKLFGVKKPTPTPHPGPAPSDTLIVSVSVTPVPSAATLTIDTLSPINGVSLTGLVTFEIPRTKAGWGAQLVLQADGFVDFNSRVILPTSAGPIVGPVVLVTIPKPVGPQWTKSQLVDLQGDLMIYMPELGYPAYTGINVGAARGLGAGWIWTLYLPWFNAVDRQKIYAKIKGYGFTHVAIGVSAMNAGDTGYHNLNAPASAEFAANYGSLMNTIHQELIDANLIPIVAGPAPGPAVQGGSALAPGFDASKVLVAMSDWDNTGYAAERIKFISDTFPKAWLYYERPGDPTTASGIQVSPNVPNSADANIKNGGQWLKDMQGQCPRFVGVLYEVNNWPGGASVADCVKEIFQAFNGFWRDIQNVIFETNTYDKFWNGAAPSVYDALDVQLKAALPLCKGFMSGGATHPPIQDAPPTPGVGAGELDASLVTWVGGPDIGAFAQTTKLTKVSVNLDGLEFEFDKREGPNRWPDTAAPGQKEPGLDMGGLEYSIGVCYQVGGKWYGSAPIETWFGHNTGLGGAIQMQDVGDGTGRGQLVANWFYDGRWAPLNSRNPAPNEVIGIFVCAGDARNNYNPVKERSNIVLVPLPAPNTARIFTF